MAVVARPSSRRKPALLDRVLGTSRRRRQAGYVAIAAGLRLLRPTLHRIAAAFTATVGLLVVVAAYVLLVA